MNKSRRVAVRGIIFHGGKLLVTKFKMADGSESDFWGTFGGGVDDGEALIDALKREMIEETAISPKVGKLLFIQQFGEKNKENLEFFFQIENPLDYESINFETTTHGAIELTRSEFLDPSKHNILPAFLQEIDIHDYIINDRPVYMYSELPVNN